MCKILITFLVCLQLMSLFSINVFGYTVDDVRDLLGETRVDDKFTKSEMETIITQYEQIERQNMKLKLFEVGKDIDIDSEVLEKYDKYNKELEETIDVLANSFESGKALPEVLKAKSKVESILHKLNSLRKIGLDFKIEYIPNIWSEKYQEVMNVLSEMRDYYDIGYVGQDMKPPYSGNLSIFSPFGVRLNRITLNSVEKHNGIDFNLYNGCNILSQWNGVVSKIYEKENEGYTVEISHGDNLKTIYSHLKLVNVEVGSKIEQYKIIGQLGNIEKSSVCYLHFEVVLDGKSVNPIYLYGENGLQAFKTYVSTYGGAYNQYSSQLEQLEENIKNLPTKEVIKEEESDWHSPINQSGFSTKKFRENLASQSEEEENEEDIENNST